MSEQLKPFAEAIGEMCNEWAHLEQWVNRLFLAVGGWDYRMRNALLMSRCIGVRDQIAATKLGVINRCPNAPFLNTVIAALDYIDNELRTARNEYVHHIWAPDEGGVLAVKVDLNPRAGKQPGTGVRTIQQWENWRISIEEVREVIADIINERIHLGQMVPCFQSEDQDEVERLVLLVKPPQRLHLLRRAEKQSQKDKARAHKKPRQKPSRS